MRHHIQATHRPPTLMHLVEGEGTGKGNSGNHRRTTDRAALMPEIVSPDRAQQILTKSVYRRIVNGVRIIRIYSLIVIIFADISLRLPGKSMF